LSWAYPTISTGWCWGEYRHRGEGNCSNWSKETTHISNLDKINNQDKSFEPAEGRRAHLVVGATQAGVLQAPVLRMAQSINCFSDHDSAYFREAGVQGRTCGLLASPVVSG
jgi:hypothetical protein